MLAFVLKMNLVQIRERNKAIMVVKAVDLLLCAFVIAGREANISTYCILMGGFMQFSLWQTEYNKSFYIVPKKNEVMKRFIISNCRIRTAIDVIFVLLAAILINICSNGEWNQTMFIRMFLMLALMCNCLYVTYLPAGFCGKRDVEAACCIIGAVIVSFVSILGFHFKAQWSIGWIIISILSLALAEYFMRICKDQIYFGDYDNDRKILGRRGDNDGRATN